ncbi:hypothetical protein NGRA_2047 [Nosema granulosis]|uniref:Pol polyprotein n=1 Tax=Nosema granulosis TaxID=83296 RepID=A0A9P6GYA0_9MICR|nr:hypothetical protein NGRA_2047 [Nosema granulosis]
MAKLNLKTSSQIKEHIIEIERTIVNLSRENPGKNTERYSIGKNYQSTPQEKTNQGIYCKYHKTSNHGTEECRALARKNNGTQPQNFVLKEPRFETKLLQINGIIGETETKFTIDTGATNNFISETIVNKYNLRTTETEPSEVTYGNGQTSQSTKCVPTSINQLGTKTMNKAITFVVIKNLPEDTILGNNFLKDSKAIIKFDNSTLQLDDTILHLNNQEILDWKNSPYYQLVCKHDNSTAQHVPKDIPEQSKSTIERAIKTNPELGTLPSDGIRIPLKDNIPVFSKPYSIPYNLHKGTKEEIEKLIRLGVVQKSSTIRITSMADSKEKW